MVDLAVLVNNIVTKLKAIPDLVSFVGAANIFAYHHVYPKNSSLGKAIATLKPGQVMVAYEGTQPPSASMSYWSHRFAIYFRAPEEQETAAPSGSYKIIRLIFDGVPQPGTCRMREIQFLPHMDPMTGETAELGVDEQGTDFFQIRFMLAETTP